MTKFSPGALTLAEHRPSLCSPEVPVDDMHRMRSCQIDDMIRFSRPQGSQ